MRFSSGFPQIWQGRGITIQKMIKKMITYERVALQNKGETGKRIVNTQFPELIQTGKMLREFLPRADRE